MATDWSDHSSAVDALFLLSPVHAGSGRPFDEKRPGARARLLTLPGAGHDLEPEDWIAVVPAVLANTG